MQRFENAREAALAMRPDDPVYCFHPEVLKSDARKFMEMFPGKTAYAVKTNGEPMVLKALVEAGVDCFDVASPGEFAAVRAVSPDADPAAQIASLTRAGNAAEQALGNLSLRPRQVVLFPNGFKDEAPDKKRPDLWGAVNFGDGSPIARSSVWFAKTRNGEVMLTGATSYPIPGKSEAQMQAAEPQLADMIARGEITKGMPEKKKGRGRE